MAGPDPTAPIPSPLQRPATQQSQQSQQSQQTAPAVRQRDGLQSRQARRFRQLLFLSLFLTFDLIMFGAFVRVVDAGLGCPDWPGCYGQLSPIGAMENIKAEVARRPDGPVTVFKAWVEMLHRYVASALGLMIIALAFMARRHPKASFGLALFTLFWVILQGLFGMWTVTLRLQPIIVTGHLLGGVILFALLLVQAIRVAGHPPVAAVARDLLPMVRLALALVFVQIALGGWVSSNYATLVCRDFPMCQGSFWPDMNIAAGFELWRPLGLRADGSALPFPALTAIHYAHRLMAYLVLAVAGWLAWRAWRVQGAAPVARWIAAALVLQLVTGLTNIFLDWPAIASCPADSASSARPLVPGSKANRLKA